MAADEPIVEFKVKDLFLKIDRKLDEISTLIHNKADKSELEKLETQVQSLEKAVAAKAELEKVEGQVQTLEKAVAAKAAVEAVESNTKNMRSQWVAILLSTLLGLGSLVAGLWRH